MTAVGGGGGERAEAVGRSPQPARASGGRARRAMPSPEPVPPPGEPPSAAGAAAPVPPLLRPSPGLRLLAAVVLAALIGVVGGGLAAWGIYLHLGPAQKTIEQLVPGPKGGQGETVGQLATAAGASVAAVATRPATATGIANGGGGFANGAVVSADGLILTSAHAVQGASQLRVGLSTGQAFDAVIAGTDPRHGLVLLRAVGAQGLTPIPIASTAPSVGDTAIIVYSPPGSGLGVEVGTVSSVGETVTTGGGTGTGTGSGAILSGAISIDAIPQPAADGGLVLDSEGKLVGIVATVSGPAVPPGVTALSISAARSLIAQVTGGTAQPQPSFGAESVYLDPAHAAAENLTAGALVTAVTPGGPAAQAGILAGDIVTSVDGTPVDPAHPFEAASLGLAAGDSVAVTVVRAGTTQTLTLRVGTD